MWRKPFRERLPCEAAEERRKRQGQRLEFSTAKVLEQLEPRIYDPAMVQLETWQ